jgi:hypothetical protein
MTETNHQLWNRLVNSKWPANLTAPEPAEAVRGAKRLYRRAIGHPWRGKVVLTSGRSHTWIRRGVFFVNPKQNMFERADRGGWPEIVHAIAHLAHRRLHPGDRPHSHAELYIERDLTDYVLAQGWLDGKLKSKSTPKPPRDIVRDRHARILAREKLWQAKQQRAQRALAKVQRERRAYESRHGERVE